MKRLLFIALLVVFACEDKEKDYIDCKWLKTQNTDLEAGSVYCVSDCPEGDTVKDCSWVHLFLDTQVVKYLDTNTGNVIMLELTYISYTYEEN